VILNVHVQEVFVPHYHADVIFLDIKNPTTPLTIATEPPESSSFNIIYFLF